MRSQPPPWLMGGSENPDFRLRGQEKGVRGLVAYYFQLNILIALKVVDFNTKNCCVLYIECCSWSGSNHGQGPGNSPSYSISSVGWLSVRSWVWLTHG